jgi:hypothetical protein
MPKMHKRKQKNSKTITWEVSGLNWVWTKSACPKSCPVELATQAIEEVWNNIPPDSADPNSSHTTIEKAPKLGLVLFIKNNLMKNEEETFMVCSQMALANGGFHHEAKKLQDHIKRLK